MGGYRRAKKNGKDVAGVYPLMEEGQHPAWATYVSVTDAAATAALIGENGGTTIVAPMDIGMGQSCAGMAWRAVGKTSERTGYAVGTAETGSSGDRSVMGSSLASAAGPCCTGILHR